MKNGHIATLRAVVQLDDDEPLVLSLSAYCLQRDCTRR